VDWIGFIGPPLIRARQFIAASAFHKVAQASLPCTLLASHIATGKAGGDIITKQPR